MEATALTMGHDALWSLSVIAVVVGPPALLVAIAVWVTRRVARLRTTRATAPSPVAARPPASAAGG
jgi:hypothetical protein